MAGVVSSKRFLADLSGDDFDTSVKRMKAVDECVAHFEDEDAGCWSFEAIVSAVTAAIEAMIANADEVDAAAVKASPRVSVFFSTRRQKFTLDFYVRRLVQYTDCSASVYAVALMYIQRALRNEPLLVLNELSLHRLLIAATVLAVKYLEDETYNNGYYARVGGLASHAEMNALEAGLLNILDFRLGVRAEDFGAFRSNLTCIEEPPMSPLSDC